jgi:hypothetical protein
MRRRLICLALASPLVVIGWGALPRDGVLAPDDPAPTDDKARPDSASQSASWTTAVDPKPLSPVVLKGLGWLAEHQLPAGGWGQGEESANMGGAGALKDSPNVADTCIAALALIRSGSTPTTGPYKDAIFRAVRFVRSQVDTSDADSLSVSTVTGTRVQLKLGPNIDTFLASMLLAEVKGRMPDEESLKGVDLALNKVLGKIQKHQKTDGSFDGAGWAPVLAQAMCGKGINRASQAGAAVPAVVLARAEEGAKLSINRQPVTVGTSAFGVGGFASAGRGAMASAGTIRGDAGVALYGSAADLGVLQDSFNTAQGQRETLNKQAAQGKDESERKEARTKLEKIADLEKTQDVARAAVVTRLADKSFVAGFGSNGGEKFLSYMNIAETLVVKGGDDWKKWDSEMTENLKRVQNGDGSWSGHHCITGRTFCTSTALLVMMADRTPIPVKRKAEAGTDGKAAPESAKVEPQPVGR